MIQVIVDNSKVKHVIPVHQKEKLIQNYPSWDRFVLRVNNQRFDDLLDTLNELAFHNLDEGLLDYLGKQFFALD
ncbi:MAG: CRP/FNR family transcriptional regulator [Chitinophagales bacterium]